MARLAKTKQCDRFGEWIKSITATAPDVDDIVKRWKSLIDRLRNKHDDCYHDPLDIQEERKKWFNAGSYILIIHHQVF